MTKHSWFIIIWLVTIQTVFAQGTGFRNGPAHEGLYPSLKGHTLSSIQWKASTGSAVRSTPLAFAGRVYAGSADRYLYCWNEDDGARQWKFEANASVCSSPATNGQMVFFVDRSNWLYAVDAVNGRLRWKIRTGIPLSYEWAFDPYRSSPVLFGKQVYVGSMDGNLYALDAETGKVIWKHDCGAVIFASPTIADGKIFVGDAAGVFHSLNLKDGQEKWIFRTHGDTMDNEKEGFDRKAILSTASYSDGLVYFGSRDGFLYAVNVFTGQAVWELDYDVSWVISSPAIKDSFLIAATSDGHYINAVNKVTGKELWRFNIRQPCWSSPVISDGIVIAGASDGFLYTINIHSGKEISRYRLGDKILSSPVISKGRVIVGCDDGQVYCFNTSDATALAIKKYVFWMSNAPGQFFRYGLDLYIRDYFQSAGYQVLNEKSIDSVLSSIIQHGDMSVIVFASNFFPLSITSGAYHRSRIFQYLQQGGKVVMLGTNPAVFGYDPANKVLTGFDYPRSDTILGIRYPYTDLRSNKGPLGSMPTKEGMNWGLVHTVVSQNPQPPGDVLPLALDEDGQASCWVKQYGTRKGSGFVQLYLTVSNLGSIEEVQRVAEYFPAIFDK